MKRLLIVGLPLAIAAALALLLPHAFAGSISNADDVRTLSPTTTASAMSIPAGGDGTPSPAVTAPVALADIGQLGEVQKVLAQLYSAVNPSVVSIWTQASLPDLSLEIPVQPEIPPSQSSRTVGPGQFGWQEPLGSGFVWDKEGHIVTNNHVVQDMGELYVSFPDGLTVPASIVGQDRRTDLAVLKVDVPEDVLRPVAVGDSTQVSVGQFVVAVGNPFGYEGSMTFGIISAVGRYLPVLDEQQPLGAEPQIIPDVIQTDAPVNPGNSGGVLVDLNGHVIGVTSNGVPGLSWSTGVAFAIPSVIVQRVVPALIENGSYEPPWLGANAATLMPQIAEAMNLPKTQQGALVVDVTAGSPADEAGVRGSGKRVTIDNEDWLAGGDVIIAMDVQPIKRAEDIETYLVRYTQPGQSVKLKIIRDGEETVLTATVGTRAAPQTEEPSGKPSGERAWLGINGVTLGGELAKAMKLQENQGGVLIQSVVAGSPADQAGFRGGYKAYSVNGEWVMIGGDVIVGAGGKPVAGVEDLAGVLGKMAPGDRLSLTILRDGKQTDVAVTLATLPIGTM
jgi:serine protease Do